MDEQEALQGATEVFPQKAARSVQRSESFPLIALQGVRDLRNYLDAVEQAAVLRAAGMGATASDIADALGLTRQAIHYKLRRLRELRSERDAPEVPTG